MNDTTTTETVSVQTIIARALLAAVDVGVITPAQARYADLWIGVVE